MARIGYRHLTVILTVIIGLACEGLQPAAAAEPAKPVAGAAGKLEVFPPYGVVLGSPSDVVAFDGKTGHITISTGQGDQVKRRAEASFASVAQFKALPIRA